MTPATPHDDRRRWLALYVLCVGMLMIVLDATIVNVALPSIQEDLGFSQSSLAWLINAYLIATTAFGRIGQGRLARASAEFMGAEAVHRALALQSLGQLGNDRVFMRYRFSDIDDIVQAIVSAGVRFGTATPQGSTNYDFVEVRRRTPDDPDVNTRTPR